MVSLSGPTTASITEGLPGTGNVSASGTVVNTEPGTYSWLAGGYDILSAPSFGTLTITQNTANGEGGYTWSFVVDSDDPALDGLDAGQSLDVTFNIRVTDTSFDGTNSTVNGTAVVDTHQVTITIFGETEVCFARGTEILTNLGPRRIETLRVGDLVMTRDSGLQPLRWISASKVNRDRRRGNSQLDPVAIAPDTFAPGVPNKTLRVSPQHRLLMEGPHLDLLLAQDAALVSAKSLVNGDSIFECGAEVDDLEYWHIVLEKHEIVFADGCPAETLHLGDVTLSTLTEAQIEELHAIFPGLTEQQGELAHVELRGFEGQVLSRALSPALMTPKDHAL
ncbi:Hint domain-containing protein [Aliiroseovarius sp. F47248L]|uniref:Hint domain-containing protein n=1 Tax=Aliiroseovarius sp. F47248L TaxID=2926420 RepID=UPI001FF5BD1F|nr:Hint domain-containing protein [Aliiroseovarius sp. F47248L]MCK0138333.1 Hint domain-containing protein [Aliiroseovarius sp. F47248L]